MYQKLIYLQMEAGQLMPENVFEEAGQAIGTITNCRPDQEQ